MSMTDIYGIGNALRSMVSIYQQTSRRSGRTSTLLSTVKDGDCVVFSTRKEAVRVRDLARERGIIIQTRVCKPTDPGQWVYEVGRDEIGGRIMFDHSWVEEYYQRSIDDAEERLRAFEAYINRKPEPTTEVNYTRREL